MEIARTARDPVPRASARRWLMLTVGVALALRLWNCNFFLPHVFYSDYAQIDIAKDLLLKGRARNFSSYPATHVYAYAVADWFAYLAGRIGGMWSDWASFLQDLSSMSDPTTRHLVGRVYTAIVGALLPLGVYRLGRVHYARGVALLAAAAVAVSPAHVIYSHQPRIHVPGIVLLTFAAAATLRAGQRHSWKRWMVAAALTGACASVIQLGMFWCAAAVICIGLSAIPWRERLLRAAVYGVGTAIVYLLLTSIANWPDVMLSEKGASARILGIPVATFRALSFATVASSMGSYITKWLAAEPAMALGAAAVVVSVAQRRMPWRPTLQLLIYPMFVAVLLGMMYTIPRYSLSIVPFVSIVVSAGVLSMPSRAVRLVSCALLVGVPLALSIRYDYLIGTTDSRIELYFAVPDMESNQWRVGIARQVLIPGPLPPNVEQFPPLGDYSLWPPLGKELPQETLAKQKRDLFIRQAIPTSIGSAPPENPAQLQYFLAGVIEGTREGEAFLPDAPDYICYNLWQAARCGPAIEIWARSPGAARFAATFKIAGLTMLQ